MLKSHERFHSANGKRQILVADDEFVNRELLRLILQDDYELIFAEDGQRVIDQIIENKDTLSLVLLDLIMPKVSGMEILRWAKSDPDVSQVPIIVVTSDQSAEIECLTLGAIDFIPKPYPEAGVIKARILRTIELSEDRQIIKSTERDDLTGLYNREFFYRYAEQFDQHHKDMDMDAIVVDVNHFHMINERFGTPYGDRVLMRISSGLRSAVIKVGGIVCRREADTFMVYCPHGIRYDDVLDSVAAELMGEELEEIRVWLRMGVYAHADKTLDIERRFDRAKMAADTVKGSFTRRIGFYDNELHERQLYSEQLIQGFDTAINERQFQVYYQPKFDVQQEIPVLASAEALVRWMHPTLGMISPGVFIPLFEDNGLIQRLDTYVWREAAAQIRNWKERFDFVVPVSVNVSRIDMYDPHLVDTLLQILQDNDLSTHEFLLEITESAYTQDSEQIIETVSMMRGLGFRVEMDDFGTGYSSLNMISALPIDALKLDMQFIRSAFSGQQDTKMLEVIIDIADYLGVPVIAEGVETEQQMIALREMGCDYVQGFYFSRPVPASEYEKFVVERKGFSQDVAYGKKVASGNQGMRRELAIGEITHALSSGFEAIFYVDVLSNHYVEFSSQGRQEDLQIENSGSDFFADTLTRILETVCAEDQARVAFTLQKDALLSQLTGHEPLLMTYRVKSDGEPVYYTLKAVRSFAHDDHHVVIGISNVDSQVRQVGPGKLPNELDFVSLAHALSDDMESIYYVDVHSGSYMEFRSDGSYCHLRMQASGDDFFGDCNRNIQDVIFPDDRGKVASALDRETLLSVLHQRSVFSMVYRLLVDGHAMYYRMKALWAEGAEGDHMIIGVTNVDDHIFEYEKLDDQRQNSVSYASIVQALATDYIAIYYVNTENDHFVEYSSHELYRDLGIEVSGDDFFTASRENTKRVVHPADMEMFLAEFTKENVMAELQRNHSFTLTYRLMFKDASTYVHMKATRMEDCSDPHIVIGVSNVDDQIRREQEHARALRMANHDALTGVKSKYAWSEDCKKINAAISEGVQQPFAVVVCDVNGLKKINDTMGHSAGDQYLKDACMVVCNVFKHSPVYRIGGDEFAVLLRGSDFDQRKSLMANLADGNQTSGGSDGISIAGGLSVYRLGEDTTMASVFERADAAMYLNKKSIKATVAE